jgi:hypothetical protein
VANAASRLASSGESSEKMGIAVRRLGSMLDPRLLVDGRRGRGGEPKI